MRDRFDPEQARALRHQAILANHAHYLERIPAYRRFAEEEGIGALSEIEPIEQNLMFPDDLFKSYDQRWLDERNFTRMNAWLSEIFHQPVEVDVRDITTIEGWIERLQEHGLRLVYSSGTSGNFSFIPRDQANWELFTTASTAYIAPLLLTKKVGAWWQRLAIRPAVRWLPPSEFRRVTRQVRLQGYDAVFLDFAKGRTGNQTLEQELGPFFRKCYFLYEMEFSPSVLRLVTRGVTTAEEAESLRKLQEMVADRKQENYARILAAIRHTTAEGQRIFIFGTTQQYKELCETIAEEGKPLEMRPGSLVLFGGGWKSFTGEKISRPELIRLMSENLNLPAEYILEGYSMTEINAFMLRCEAGRFHIPPTIEPVIFNEELEPVRGADMRGIFGFLDPFAISYPGFIISGDEVHYVEGECACGLYGPAVTEIGRARSREVKGCGGIMASLRA